MAQQTGTKAPKQTLKRARYKSEERRKTNKEKKIKKQIKRFESMKKRNPTSKVDRVITELKQQLREIYK